MSYASTTLVDCPDIQTGLNNLFLTCDSSRLREPAPFSDFLWSDMNRNGVQQYVSPGGGKNRTVVATYEQRLLESEATAADLSSPNCTATSKRGELSTSFTLDITDGYEVEELMSTADWIQSCRSNPEIIISHVQKLIDALYRKNATLVTSKAAALLGGWDSTIWDDTNSNKVTEGSTDYLKIKTLKASSTDLNPGAVEDIDFALMESGFCINPVLFSARTLYKYMRTMQAGCCSDQGVDLSAMLNAYGRAVVYDRRMAAAAGGADYAWAVMPGALQVLSYTSGNDGSRQALQQLTGQSAFVGSNYIKMTIMDPQSGQPMDLIIKDDCEAMHFKVRNVVDVVSMPLDMFAPGDEKEGVSFFSGIKVVNS